MRIPQATINDDKLKIGQLNCHCDDCFDELMQICGAENPEGTEDYDERNDAPNCPICEQPRFEDLLVSDFRKAFHKVLAKTNLEFLEAIYTEMTRKKSCKDGCAWAVPDGQCQGECVRGREK